MGRPFPGPDGGRDLEGAEGKPSGVSGGLSAPGRGLREGGWAKTPSVLLEQPP